MDKLILKNGKEVILEAGADLSALKNRSASIAEMATTFAEFTKENLSEVVIKNDAGLTIGTYTGLKFVLETSVVEEDGTVLTTYSLRERTEIEKRLEVLEEEQAVLAEGQEVQDEAIADLGSFASALVESVEGAGE